MKEIFSLQRVSKLVLSKLVLFQLFCNKNVSGIFVGYRTTLYQGRKEIALFSKKIGIALRKLQLLIKKFKKPQ